MDPLKNVTNQDHVVVNVVHSLCKYNNLFHQWTVMMCESGHNLHKSVSSPYSECFLPMNTKYPMSSRVRNHQKHYLQSHQFETHSKVVIKESIQFRFIGFDFGKVNLSIRRI